ncbi:hypothetical protein QWT87_02905 [Chryseobacterium sp. APV1]|uniref:Uncharacterized protein n=2 Tax=Chryseobacterium TaxID=59732 RepID=A0A202C3R3_9FLAO|nr:MULTISPECIES: hypothetical protein [Chryseobacterium]MDO3423823.1 hypothetical protein [Chryseobacterium sp. APV1]OVE58225.1 hypothetical protein B0E34_08600 [Chryseobacterium mucoviscidosis]
MKKQAQNTLAVIFAIGFVIIYKSLYKDETYEEEIEKKEIKSVVAKKFVNYDNHGIHYIVYEKDSIMISESWDQYINVGDSIIKPEQSTQLIIKNKDKYIELDFNNPNLFPLK